MKEGSGPRIASAPGCTLLALALALVPGCRLGSDSQRPGSGGGESAYRFIEEEPSSLLDPAAVDESLQVFTWTFETPAELVALDRVEAELPPWLLGNARMGPQQQGAFILRREVDFGTSSVGAILVRARGLRRVTLLWAGPGQPFSRRRQIDVGAARLDASGIRSYLVPLVDHAEWRDPVERLLLVAFPRRSTAELLEVQALGLSVPSPRPLKVDLGRDVRNALAASPGQAIERELGIPEGGELHFVYGARWIEVPVRFQVSIESPRRDRRIVFDEVVSSSGESEGAVGRPPDRWHEAVVDLSEFGGETVRLGLETRSGEALGGAVGLVFWGHPEVVDPASSATLPNIVLISIDTLRADRLSLYGNPRPTSPHLDAWARRSGVVFRNAVAAAPWTLPSHVSMLSGLDAHRHGFNDIKGAVGDSLLLAPEILRRNGYATLGVVGGGPLHPLFRLTQGFDIYAYWLDQGIPGDLPGSERELETNVDRALDWLRPGRRQPFFLFFHTYEVHSPHSPREPFFSSFSRHRPELEISVAAIGDDSRPAFLGPASGRAFRLAAGEADGSTVPLPPELASAPIDMYDSRIAFTDRELSRLFSRLEEPDLEGNTIVVVTSDHGELLGEHGLAGHAYLHEKNLLVPLVIASPDGLGAGIVVEEQVRGVDVLPTILDLAGLPVPEGLDGVSLVPAMEGRSGEVPAEAWSYSARNQGISLRRGNRLKYIFQDAAWTSFYGHEALYDLARDPDEAHNLSKTSPEVGQLRERIRSRIEGDARGLWARFENAGTVPLSGSLRGAMIGRSQVRSVDLPCPCAAHPSADEATFRVPPGERFTLRFIAGGLAEMQLTLAVEGGPELTATIDPEAIAGTEAFVLTGSSWERGPPPPAPRTGITFWWRGKQQAVGSSPLDDEEVLRELRALGYVD